MSRKCALADDDVDRRRERLLGRGLRRCEVGRVTDGWSTLVGQLDRAAAGEARERGEDQRLRGGPVEPAPRPGPGRRSAASPWRTSRAGWCGLVDLRRDQADLVVDGGVVGAAPSASRSTGENRSASRRKPRMTSMPAPFAWAAATACRPARRRRPARPGGSRSARPATTNVTGTRGQRRAAPREQRLGRVGA